METGLNKSYATYSKYLRPHVGQVTKSETLLSILLRIVEKKQETSRSLVFCIDYGCSYAGDFFKASSFVKAFYILLLPSKCVHIFPFCNTIKY